MDGPVETIRLPYAAAIAMWPYFVAASMAWFVTLNQDWVIAAIATTVAFVGLIIRSLRTRTEIRATEFIDFRLFRTVRLQRSTIQEIVVVRHLLRNKTLPVVVLLNGSCIPVKSLGTMALHRQLKTKLERAAEAMGVPVDLTIQEMMRLPADWKDRVES